MVYGQFVVSNIRLVAPFQLGGSGLVYDTKVVCKGGLKVTDSFLG